MDFSPKVALRIRIAKGVKPVYKSMVRRLIAVIFPKMAVHESVKPIINWGVTKNYCRSVKVYQTSSYLINTALLVSETFAVSNLIR